MNTKRQILRNMNWNWAGTLGDMVVSFLLCPFLLTELGATHYGAWVMIGALTGYFGLLDLGVRGSVGRYVAFYRARKDSRAVSEIVMTALALLIAAGLLSLLATAAAAIWASGLMGGELDPAELPTLRLALLLAGVNLAVQLPMKVADGVLWGCQRFDQLNAVRIPFDIARGLLSAGVIYLGGGLVALASIALLLTLVSGLIKASLAIRSEPSLRLRMGRVRRGRVREVFSFGIWSTIRSLTAMIPARGTPLLVGALLGVSMVAPLSIAARLIASASAILVAASGVITPLATTSAATIFMALFVWLGKPLIVLWVGSDMLLAYPMLLILAAGRWLSMSQVVTRSIITAQARHRALALSSLAQAVVSLGLGLVLIRFWGVFGIVAAVAVGDAVCEGLFSWFYGCRLLGVSPLRYAFRVIGSTIAALALPCGLLAAATWLRPVDTWLELCIHGMGFVLLSLVCVLLVNEYSLLKSRLQTRATTGEQAPCAI
jgi:O-antigen/teichoic acid export membrane protein